jgi:hypothetical protein
VKFPLVMMICILYFPNSVRIFLNSLNLTTIFNGIGGFEIKQKFDTPK